MNAVWIAITRPPMYTSKVCLGSIRLDDESTEEEQNNVVGIPDEEGLVIQPKVRCTLCMGEISH